MNLGQLSDLELHLQTEAAAITEREATTALLNYLCEIEARRLFAKYGCSSLFDYCVRVLKMSEPQAARRVNASRLLSECPEIAEKINSGALTLTTASQVQTFFKKEQAYGNSAENHEKSELLEKLERKSTREVERLLVSFSSRPEEIVKESVRVISETTTEIRLAVDQDLLKDLNRLKEIWSNEMPNASYGDVIKKMAKLCRERHDPMLIAERFADRAKKERPKKNKPLGEPLVETLKVNSSGPTDSSPAPAPESALLPIENPTPKVGIKRYIPTQTKRAVWLRDGGNCTFVDKPSGRICGSRHQLQIDHVKPFAMGGDHGLTNLRLRCFAHNQWHALQTYGRDVLKYNER